MPSLDKPIYKKPQNKNKAQQKTLLFKLKLRPPAWTAFGWSAEENE
jgi:hypothetical protein